MDLRFYYFLKSLRQIQLDSMNHGESAKKKKEEILAITSFLKKP